MYFMGGYSMKSDGLLKFERKSTKNMSNFYLYIKSKILN